MEYNQSTILGNCPFLEVAAGIYGGSFCGFSSGGGRSVWGSSGLCVGGLPDEGFSRPIELSAAPADTPYTTLLCASDTECTILTSPPPQPYSAIHILLPCSVLLSALHM